MQTMKMRFSAAFICLLGILLSLAISVLIPLCASADEESGGTLTLVCESDGTSLQGITWNIYKIGERTDGAFVLTGIFEGKAEFDDLSEEAVAKTAETLAEVAADSESDFTATTDTDGKAVVSGLDNGLYLICANDITIEKFCYTPAAAVVEISTSEPNATVYPKFSITEVPDDSSVPDDVSEPDESSIPDDNSVPDESSIVDESSVPNESSIPDESSEKDGSSVTDKSSTTDDSAIPNSSSTPDTSSSATTSSQGESVPQTGQLWWPVPILAAIGLVFIAIGMRLRTKRENGDNE